jgi:hypothetical protein
MHTPITSLPLTLSKILDRIGSDDYYYQFDFSDPAFSAIDPPELLVLEESLRGLVARVQNLERIVDRCPGYPVGHRLAGNGVHVSSTCGHTFQPVPLTPDEASELEPTSSTSRRNHAHLDSTYNGYESSVSDGTTISISSDNLPSDSIVRIHSLPLMSDPRGSECASESRNTETRGVCDRDI